MATASLPDPAAVRVLDPSRWVLSGAWRTDPATGAPTARGDGATAVQDVGPLERATLTVSLGFLDAPAGIVVRSVDADHHTIVEADPAAEVLRILRVTDGRREQLVEAPSGAFGSTATLRVDLDGPYVTIFDLAGNRLVSASVTEGADSGVLGVVQSGVGSTRLDGFTVGALRGPSVTWPVFAHRSASPDVQLVPGTWEDTDINNPNVVWDPDTERWVMYYTGYSATKPTGDDGVQMAGIASAATLDGPWTKDPGNPVIADLDTGAWSQNGGMERLADGTWIIAANVNAGTPDEPRMGTWFYTAPRPAGPWTRTTTELAPYVGDPWLRISQKTGDLEHWAWTLSGTRRIGTRWTSADGGRTWSAPRRVIPNPPIHGVNNGEQTVWVAPGREGRDMWVTADFFPSTRLEDGRGMLMAYSPDDGATWLWHVALTSSGSLGWDARAAFDSDPVYDEERGRMYLFHAGSERPDSGTLNFDIRIGHAWAAFDHTVEPYRPGR